MSEQTLVERLTTEADLIDAGMNLDDGQTIECLRDAATCIAAMLSALKGVVAIELASRGRPGVNGEDWFAAWDAAKAAIAKAEALPTPAEGDA